MFRLTVVLALVLGVAAASSASVTFNTSHGDPNQVGLAAAISSTDLLQGMIAVELPGDLGWHPALSDPLDKLPAFTDGVGDRGTGLTGLLNDFPGAGNPAKKIRYDFTSPTTIGAINFFSGNNGRDGRIFHTYTVEWSTDGGGTWSSPIYVQSDPSGTLNNQSSVPQFGSTLTQLFDNSGPLALGATNLRFNLFAVDNTGGEMRDPYDGVNPFTGLDDGLSAAFESPLIREIDVLVPEPGSLLALGAGLAGFAGAWRRRRS